MIRCWCPDWNDQEREKCRGGSFQFIQRNALDEKTDLVHGEQVLTGSRAPRTFCSERPMIRLTSNLE